MSPGAALRLAAALAALPALAGCFVPTWRALPPGAAPAGGAVVLVGRISLVPPLGLARAPAPGEVLGPEQVPRVVAFFTPDLSEPFRRGGDRLPLDDAWTALVPLDTWFFIEVPRRGTLYLRGVVAPGGGLATVVEAPARITLGPADRVAYVGDLTVVRADAARLSCRTRTEDARRAAAALGHAALLDAPWAVRVAVPVAR